MTEHTHHRLFMGNLRRHRGLVDPFSEDQSDDEQLSILGVTPASEQSTYYWLGLRCHNALHIIPTDGMLPPFTEDFLSIPYRWTTGSFPIQASAAFQVIDRDGRLHPKEWIPSLPFGALEWMQDREAFISCIREQAVELRSIEDGWLNGYGKAPSDEGLDWMIEKFQILSVFRIPIPYLYPTESGGVQAEWSLNQREISLEIDLDKKIADWHDLDLDTDVVIERPVNCERLEDWFWILERLKDAV